MSETIFLSSGRSELVLSGRNGAILGLRFDEKELLVSGTELFTLQFLDRSGEPTLVASSEFSMTQSNGSKLLFSAHSELQNLKVTVNIRGNNGFFHFRFAVEDIPEELVLEWLDGPQPVFGPGRIFWPASEGTEIRDPAARENSPYGRYHPLGFPIRGRSFGCFYPGEAQMQFMAHYDGGFGVYFAAHDPEDGTKAVEFAPAGPDRTRFSLQTFTGCQFGESYRPAFEYVLGGFAGDWIEACDIYRNWIDSRHLPPPKYPAPAWLDDSPVVLIYPVRGTGDDKGELKPNEYFPYSAALPTIRRLSAALESRTMALLMHWEGTAPWAPPYVWPPYGRETLFEEFRDRLHADNNLLGVYCSGTAWTQTSSITDYSREEQYEREGLRRYMMRGPKGEIDAVICNGEKAQRLGYDLCLTEEWSRRTILDELMKLARSGIDYAQFFDQNLGGQSNFCYSHEHRHPPVPGPWQVEAMHSLLAEAADEIAAVNPELVLGCEAAAAQPYLDILQFSDARSVFSYNHGRPVPGYAYVFHDRVSSFLGNQCGISRQLDLLACPENLLYRTAYAFNAGDFLSVVLKDDGHIHWGWVVKWEFPEPDQESVITLIRNLNGFRRRYPGLLRRGRMLRPELKVESEAYRLIFHNRVETVESVFHNRWRSPEGDEGEIVTNFLPREQQVMITPPPGKHFRFDGRECAAATEVTLPPLSAQLFRVI